MAEPIMIHDTMTRGKVPLQPEGDELKLYTCGLTVYDEPHVGNWRSYIVWDTLVRLLRSEGVQVNHVQNITDVGHLTSDSDTGEDKLAKKAAAERTTAWDVAEHYIERAVEGRRELNITEPTHSPRATDYIPQQIAFVQELEKRGFTYLVEGDGLYFDTSKLNDYGKLARLDVEGLKAGARVEQGGKRNPTDFAVWKLSPKGEQRDMEWESPWGTGFPGWHLECSVLAHELLGEHLDLHTGGIDHIPIHHTNEIAQSEAVFGPPFSRAWMHTQFMNVGGEKLSKSKGNGITLPDIQERGFEPLAYRLMVLQSHYRTHANFTYETLEAAQNRLATLRSLADLRFQFDEEGSCDPAALQGVTADMRRHLADDLNTPLALAALAELEAWASRNALHPDCQEAYAAVWGYVDAVLGLELTATQDIDQAAKEKIALRAEAKRKKDFPEADRLRDELTAQGIELDDTAFGARWRRA